MAHDFTPGRRTLLKALVAFPFTSLRLIEFSPLPSDIQPLLAQVGRVVEAMAHLGEPFGAADLATLRAAEDAADPAGLASTIERLLATRCLADVRINPESRVSIARGPAPARLVEQGWRAFLVRVRNEAGVTGRLTMESPQARAGLPSVDAERDGAGERAARGHRRSLARARRPTTRSRSSRSSPGSSIEYRIVLLYSRDRGPP